LDSRALVKNIHNEEHKPLGYTYHVHCTVFYLQHNKQMPSQHVTRTGSFNSTQHTAHSVVQ
jgi:hypothetical protein